MRIAILLTALILTITIRPPSAYAIIFLPALILIPIAKIIAVLIAGVSVPSLALGTIWSKLTHHSLKRTVLVIITALLIIAALGVLILKLENPQRPLF